MTSLIGELKRRNVFRVGVAYLVVGWVIMQVIDVVVEPLHLPDWTATLVIVLLLAGLPITLFLAWAFEMTPEGVKKTKDVKVETSVTASTGRKLDFVIIGLLVLALSYFIWERQAPPTPEGESSTADITADSSEMSIAVLPFADMSPEGDQEYFSDGISEELLNVLVRVEGLKVASRTSSFGFKGQNPNIPRIAAELGVGHILEGSVRKSGNRVRITAQLIDASTDRHLWSDTYDRDLVDIFAIQDEIANAIVIALKEALGVEEVGSVSVPAATQNISAYELYLQARALFIARTDMDKSVAMFEEAVALDPAFARAWEGLAAVLSVMLDWGHTGRDYLGDAAIAADKAIALNPGLSLAYAVKGNMAGYNLPIQFDAGFENYNRAIANDPKNATAHLWRGILYMILGDLDRAMADFEACIAIDPAYANCDHHRAWVYMVRGENEKAIDIVTRVREAGFTGSFTIELDALLSMGHRLAAVQTAIIWLEDPNAPVTEWLDAIANPDGDMTEAITKWDAWFESWGGRLEEDLNFVILFRAYDRLESKPDYQGFESIWHPAYSGFRKTAQFKRFVRDLGMVDYWRANGFPPQCRELGADDFECD